jgi:hypothetical protein
MRNQCRHHHPVQRIPHLHPVLFAFLAAAVTLYTGTALPAAAQAATGHVVHGSDTSTMSSPGYGKPNQTRIWFNSYEDGWDALVPKSDGGVSASDHYIMKDVSGNQIFTPVELEDRNSGRPDVFWDDAHKLLYVLGSHTTETKIWRVHYDDGADRYHIDPHTNGVTVPGIAHGSPNRPAAIYVSPNGALWVAVMTSRGLEVQQSLDGGASWMLAPINLDASASTGVVTWSHFVDGDTTHVGVFAGENAGTQRLTLFHFWHIAQRADPSLPSNWVHDSPELPGGSAVADDHVAAARDERGTLYFVAKTQGGAATDPLIILYTRTAGSVWSMYPVTEAAEQPEQSRPSLVVDDDRAELYVFTTDTTAGVGRYKKASLLALDELVNAPFRSVFSDPGALFTDLITPRHQASSRTGIVVLAHNSTDMTMWWNDALEQNTPPDPHEPQEDPAACGTAGLPPCDEEPPECGTDDGPPCANLCEVASGKWRFRNSEIRWALENKGTGPATIERIAITWPEALKELKDVKLHSKLSHKKMPPPSATLTFFKGKDGERRIDAGKKKELRFKFQQKTRGGQPHFHIRIDFQEGCAVEWGR